jgi:hypothetical protein
MDLASNGIFFYLPRAAENKKLKLNEAQKNVEKRRFSNLPTNVLEGFENLVGPG